MYHPVHTRIISLVYSYTHTHTYTQASTYTQIHTHRTTPPIPSLLYFPNLPALCHLLSLYLLMPNVYLHVNVCFKKCPSMGFTNSLFSLNPSSPCTLLWTHHLISYNQLHACINFLQNCTSYVSTLYSLTVS